MKIKKMDLDPPRVPVGSPEIPPYAKAPSRLLTSRRSAPFPLALGFNAAIPTASRVAEYPALSRAL